MKDQRFLFTQCIILLKYFVIIQSLVMIIINNYDFVICTKSSKSHRIVIYVKLIARQYARQKYIQDVGI